MKLKIKSEVNIPKIGKTVHIHTQDFGENSNVFGRSYEYRQYMNKMFPGCEFKVLEAKIIAS